MSSRSPFDLSTAGLAPSELAGSDGGEGRYLLVLEAGSSSVVRLPVGGQIEIGRGQDADLRVADIGASRRHARLQLTPGEARIEDLESQNGTYLNGERLTLSKALKRGDVISIGEVELVFHRGLQRVVGPAVLDEQGVQRRLEEEIERVRVYERSASLACLDFTVMVDRPKVAEVLTERLRVLDARAWDGTTRLWIVLPELANGEAMEVCDRLLDGLARFDPEVRLGLATCPDDGTDADTLLTAARLAARSAHPGRMGTAGETVTRFEVAGIEVVVVEPAMIRLFGLVERLARSDLSILISGETGTGKEIVASTVHARSTRARARFVALNCAALPDSLIESELFGYERGAFSGAHSAKAGLLETADGGTVFLDEIGELSPTAQAKLLRALECRSITRLGDVKSRTVDVRVVAATNRDLVAEVKAGRFREDLYFRLSAGTVVLPPLRDRRREIPVLARKFLAEAGARHERAPAMISPEAMQRLIEHAWPGNVRELRNVMAFVAATSTGGVVEPRDLPPQLVASAAAPAAPGAAPAGVCRPIAEELRELERRRMAEALVATNGVMARAAERIGMPVRTFFHKHKQYGMGTAR
jgi:two-component system response regulator AtoC